MLSVPEPLANDPEDVVSALEAAEIFGKQGDVKEAVRWVRRAAEIAGDTGNDERALTLARAVADLNISASQPPQPAQEAQQAPPPPLPVSSDDPEGEAETRVVDSAKMLEEYERQQKSNGQNGAASEAAAQVLAPPSPDAVVTPEVPPILASTVDTVPYGAEADLPELPPPPPEPSAEAGSELAEATAEPAQERESSPPVSRRGISSMAELLARKEAEASSAMAAAEAGETGGWDDPPPPPPVPSTPPAQAVSTPPAQALSNPPLERRTARPNADRIPTPIIPSQPHTERPPVNAPILQAVRASVVATAEPGVFVLRVLTADQPPAPTAHEVLVVATNPLASPFK